MEAVVDPDEVKVVGFVPPNACLSGPWSSFVTLPVPEGADTETLGVTYDSETQTYTFITDPTKVAAKTEAAWTQLRAERNSRLTASDWTQGNDSPLSTESKSAWAAYRAALRALPNVTTDPLNPMWPSVPSP